MVLEPHLAFHCPVPGLLLWGLPVKVLGWKVLPDCSSITVGLL